MQGGAGRKDSVSATIVSEMKSQASSSTGTSSNSYHGGPHLLNFEQGVDAEREEMDELDKPIVPSSQSKNDSGAHSRSAAGQNSAGRSLNQTILTPHELHAIPEAHPSCEFAEAV